jgi:hypothetical protein
MPRLIGRSALIACIFAVAASVPAGADILGVRPAGVGSTTSSLTVTASLPFYIWGVPGEALFEELVLTSANVGSTYVANENNDSDFSAVAAKLTNGASDVIAWVAIVNDSFPTGGGFDEQFSFQLSGIDFVGKTISEIQLRLDRLTLEEETDEFGERWWEVEWTVTVIGANRVPIASANMSSLKSLYVARD